MSPTMTASVAPPTELLSYAGIRGQITAKVQKNKEWSLAIQGLIKKSSESGKFEEIQTLIDEIRPRMVELMKHHYGNYFLKTLVQVCSANQRHLILSEISESLVEISCDPQGTHAAQALVETIRADNEKEQALVVRSISSQIKQMSLNTYGTHVINKIVNSFGFTQIEGIFEATIIHFREVVCNKQGVCIVKSLMARFKDKSIRKQALLKLLKEDINNIVVDKYGNYALQEAIKLYADEETAFICDFVFDNMIQLAQNQVSSNIVEAVLQYSKKNRHRYIQKIQDSLGALVQDAFGRYVVKRVLLLVEVDAIQQLQFRKQLNSALVTYPKAASFYTTNQKQAMSPKQQSPLIQ